MKRSFDFFSVRCVAKSLLFVFVASAVCAFFSACAGPVYRHESRVENRVDRRMDRRYDRWD